MGFIFSTKEESMCMHIYWENNNLLPCGLNFSLIQIFLHTSNFNIWPHKVWIKMKLLGFV